MASARCLPETSKTGSTMAKTPTKTTKPATAKAPAKTVKAQAKPAAPKSTAAKPASPRAAPKSAPRKPAARTTAQSRPAAKPAPSTASRALGVFSIGAAIVAVGAAITETYRRLRGRATGGHTAPDLALDHDREPGDRAPDAFRPDPTAAVPASEREALRPATLPLGSGRELDSVH